VIKQTNKIQKYKIRAFYFKFKDFAEMSKIFQEKLQHHDHKRLIKGIVSQDGGRDKALEW
jgi:hypothetical protein